MVFRVEQSFIAHGKSGERFAAATISLEGEALAWFQWEEGHCLVRSQAQLLDHFGQTQEGTLCEKFLVLKQEGTVQ